MFPDIILKRYIVLTGFEYKVKTSLGNVFVKHVYKAGDSIFAKSDEDLKRRLGHKFQCVTRCMSEYF